MFSRDSRLARRLLSVRARAKPTGEGDHAMNRTYALAIALASVLTATAAHAMPRGNEIQAARDQDIQAPRDQDIQAPRH
jgi:hypothetical protein